MLLAPEPLTAQHEYSVFNSGVETLDVWLKRRALKNQQSGASRVFVACDKRNKKKNVIAYYALASGALRMEQAIGRLRRNMPDSIPVVMLGRLAVDQQWQHQGLGRALIRDAGHRVIQAADYIGIRGLIVQAVSLEAKTFYEKIGFLPSPLDPMTLMMSLADLKRNA